MNKPLTHEMLQDLHRVRQELGRVPSNAEYSALGKFSKEQVKAAFISFPLMVKLSGLQYSAKGKRDKEKIRKTSFEHLMREVADKKSLATPPAVYHRVLSIGDTHYPYTHPDATEWLIALHAHYKFDLVTHAGDEVDYHAMSFHAHDPDNLSAGHELDVAISMLEPLFAAFPRMLLAESNHGSMVHRKALHHGFPRRVIKSYRETLGAPAGWEWRDQIRWQSPNGQANLLVHSLGSNVLGVAKFKGLNLIQGHHHSLHSLQYWNNDERVMFAAQTGCLIDDTSFAMAYNKTTKERPVMGSLAILDGVPLLLRMQLNGKGRWNGKI